MVLSKAGKVDPLKMKLTLNTKDPDVLAYLLALHQVYLYAETRDVSEIGWSCLKLVPQALAFLRDILDDMVDDDGVYLGISQWGEHDWEFVKDFIGGRCREK